MAAGTIRVLVLSDRPDLAPRVRALGFEATTVEAAELLALAESQAVDHTVTDPVMPRMGGVELAKRLLERRPKPPVVYMSGYSESSAGRPGGETTGFIAKPFAPQTLLAEVSRLLSRRAS